MSEYNYGWWGLAFIARERRLERERAAERLATWTPAQRAAYEAEMRRPATVGLALLGAFVAALFCLAVVVVFWWFFVPLAMVSGALYLLRKNPRIAQRLADREDRLRLKGRATR